MPTGIEGGIGIPHARSAHVTEPSLGFGRSHHFLEHEADATDEQGVEAADDVEPDFDSLPASTPDFFT